MNYAWESPSVGVYRCRLPFLDVTVGLVCGSAGVLLIDCGTTTEEAGRIGEDVASLAGSAVTDVVLTHHHFDHVLGSAGFPQARIFAAEQVAAAVRTGVDALTADALRYGADPAEVHRAVAALRCPDRIVTHLDIDLGDRLVTVTHPGRGHTDHDLVVVVPPRDRREVPVVFCGDLIEESADPAVDSGSDLLEWPGTLQRLLELGGPHGRYVPGHGAVVDADFVVRQRDWLTRAAGDGRPADSFH